MMMIITDYIRLLPLYIFFFSFSISKLAAACSGNFLFNDDDDDDDDLYNVHKLQYINAHITELCVLYKRHHTDFIHFYMPFHLDQFFFSHCNNTLF